MKKIYLLSTFLLGFCTLLAQTDSTLYFTFNDGAIFQPTEQVFFKGQGNQIAAIQIGQEAVDLSTLHYLERDENYYKVLPHPKGGISLYLRTFDTEWVDIYQYSKATFKSYPNVGYEMKKEQFFEKKGLDLLQLNYKNLSMALSDSEESMAMLEQANKYRRIGKIALITSSAAFLTGAIISARSELSPVFAVVPIGLVVPLLLNKKKHSYYEKAIKAYNR